MVAYQNVLQSFALTGTPRRLLPVDVNVHFFSLGTEAGFKTVNTVLEDVSKKELAPVQVQDYLQILKGFQRVHMEQVGLSAWRVTHYDDCRTIRFDGVPE